MNDETERNPMVSLLDAEDELHIAHSLVELIGMTTRNNPDDDMNALAAGVDAIKSHLSAGLALMAQTKQQLSGKDAA